MAGVLKHVLHFPAGPVVRLVSRVGTVNLRQWYSTKSGGGTLTSSSPFSHSVILLQDGPNIEELPIAVRKASDNLLELQKTRSLPLLHQDVLDEPTFKQCNTLASILTKLGELKTEEVSADMAYQALEKISEMGRNVEYRNLGCIQLTRDMEENKAGNPSFTVDAVLMQLGTIITKQGTSEQLIAALRLVVAPSFPGRVESLQKLLAEDCLNRILDNQCNISQVCQAIKLFTFIQQQGWADKSWVGLLGRDLSAANIVEVYNVLPYLKESQRAIFNHVERLLSGTILPTPSL